MAESTRNAVLAAQRRRWTTSRPPVTWGRLLCLLMLAVAQAFRLDRRRGVPVWGIGLNADMRGRAEPATVPPDVPVPIYRPGRKGATGLPDSIADVVWAAQVGVTGKSVRPPQSNPRSARSGGQKRPAAARSCNEPGRSFRKRAEKRKSRRPQLCSCRLALLRW